MVENEIYFNYNYFTSIVITISIILILFVLEYIKIKHMLLFELRLLYLPYYKASFYANGPNVLVKI